MKQKSAVPADAKQTPPCDGGAKRDGGNSYEEICETIAVLGAEDSVYSVCSLREHFCPRCVWCRLWVLENDFSPADTPNPNVDHPCRAGGFLALGMGRRASFQRSWGAVYCYVLGAVQLGCIPGDVRAVVSYGAFVPD